MSGASGDPPRFDEPGWRPHGRGPARLLAPLALVLVIVAVVVIVSSVGGSGTSATVGPLVTTPVGSSLTTTRRTHSTDTESATGPSGPATLSGSTTTSVGGAVSGTTTGATGTTTTTQTTTAGTYTVQSGDTFGVISTKTGVPVATIETLNPGVSSSALTVGQVLKLK